MNGRPSVRNNYLSQLIRIIKLLVLYGSSANEIGFFCLDCKMSFGEDTGFPSQAAQQNLKRMELLHKNPKPHNNDP